MIQLAAIASAADAPKVKRFLTNPCDRGQGCFFIGEMPKVTNYASTPPPNNTNRTPQPSQITIGKRAFEIPQTTTSS
jgi:hypothetical protein